MFGMIISLSCLNMESVYTCFGCWTEEGLGERGYGRGVWGMLGLRQCFYFSSVCLSYRDINPKNFNMK